MCGRFVLHHRPIVLKDWYQAIAMVDFESHYNIAPTAFIPVVRATVEGLTGTTMRWGLIPRWAKNTAALPLLHNARSETVAEKPLFRQALKYRRCLIPASGFYEWKTVPGQSLKQPFYISLNTGEPMSFAGLWESSLTPEGNQLDTCTILTIMANSLLEPIHHRMPVILDRNDWPAWLRLGSIEPKELITLLKSPDIDHLQVWGVAHMVNKVKNNDPKLLQPIIEMTKI